MVVSNMYGHEERVTSYRIFSEIMDEIASEMASV